MCSSLPSFGMCLWILGASGSQFAYLTRYWCICIFCDKASKHSLCIQHGRAGCALASADCQLQSCTQLVVLCYGARVQVCTFLPTDKHAVQELGIETCFSSLRTFVYNCREQKLSLCSHLAKVKFIVVWFTLYFVVCSQLVSKSTRPQGRLDPDANQKS